MAAKNKHWPLHEKQLSTVEMWSQKSTDVVDAELGAGGTVLGFSSGLLLLTQVGLHGAGEEVSGGIPPQIAREERRSLCIRAAQSRDGWKGLGGAMDDVEVHMQGSINEKRGAGPAKCRQSLIVMPELQSPLRGD